jgi:hypothetical protein
MTKKETAVERLYNQMMVDPLGDWEYYFKESLKMERLQHSQTWDAALDKYEVRAGNYMRAYEDFDDYYEQFKQD